MKQTLHMDSTRTGGGITWLLAAVSILGAGLVDLQSLRAGTSNTPDAITVPLEYHVVSYSPIGVSLSVTMSSAAFKNEPDLGKAKVRRGHFSLPAAASEPVAFLWDLDARKLRVDLNGNGDLTDDPAGVFSTPDPSSPARGNYHFGTFQNVPLNLQVGGGRVPWVADLNFSEYNGGTHLYIYAAAKGYWSGKASLAGQDWEVGWLPGMYRRPGARSQDYLLLRAWADRDKNFSTSDGSLDTFMLPDKLFLASTGYDLDCRHRTRGDEVDHELAFRGRAFEPGDLTISGQYVHRLVLSGGPYTAVLDEPRGTLRVPVGRYTARQVQLGVGQALAHLQETREVPLTIAAGHPAHLLAGGPLTNTATVNRRGSDLVIEYVLRGADGENYAQAFRDYQHPPRFKIYRGDHEVASGNFEYG